MAAGRDQGARLVCGGGRPESAPGGGFYLAPTLFDRVEARHRIAAEEIFGPVLSVLTWRDRDELMRLANATPLGLTANIITRRLDWALDAARKWRRAACGSTEGPALPGDALRGLQGLRIGSEGSMESLQSYTRTKALHMLDIDVIGAVP